MIARVPAAASARATTRREGSLFPLEPLPPGEPKRPRGNPTSPQAAGDRWPRGTRPAAAAYYDAPIAPSRPRKRRATEEFDCQAALVKHLKLRGRPGVYWTAIPMGMSGVTWRRKIARLGGRTGTPDMLFVIPDEHGRGRPYGLELKAPGGSQTPAQKQAMRDWRAAGGVYALAVGLDEALAVIGEWGALR